MQVVDRLAEIDAVLDAKEEERRPKSQAVSLNIAFLESSESLVHVNCNFPRNSKVNYISLHR